MVWCGGENLNYWVLGPLCEYGLGLHVSGRKDVRDAFVRNGSDRSLVEHFTNRVLLIGRFDFAAGLQGIIINAAARQAC